MRYHLAVRLSLLVLLAKLALPTLAAAQSTPSLTRPLSEAAIQLPIAQPSPVLLQSAVRTRDSVVNGMLIGAGIGAVVGMLIAPPAFCGAHDTECATIVRVAIGLPSIAGGLGIGALVDALNSKDARPAGVAVNVRW
ncbi:MAG: YtxH domain-containing protein [Acidobacteria bacterium]|nr:MAG: YtxH domain-containing protein [Acidobacteriota bacterium]